MFLNESSRTGKEKRFEKARTVAEPQAELRPFLTLRTSEAKAPHTPLAATFHSNSAKRATV